MRLATIRTDSNTAAARVDGECLEILPFTDVRAVLESGPNWRETAAQDSGRREPLEEADFAPLVPSPEKIICVGLNYRDHAAEANLEIPGYPTIFAKYSRSLIGPHDDIVLPPNSDQVDWEVELGLVIATPTRNVDVDGARAAIAGFTIFNDISMRDWQLRTSQFLQGKTFESSTPIGPYLVTPDELEDDLDLRLVCSVDGRLMQDGRTADLVFGPNEIISYISKFITLMPGDVIATGTPAGIGAARRPPLFLTNGSSLISKIDGLGEQSNNCVARPLAETAGSHAK